MVFMSAVAESSRRARFNSRHLTKKVIQDHSYYSKRYVLNQFQVLFCNGDSQSRFIFSPQVKRVMSKGTVKWFNADKGFGFITPEDGGKDLFVHHSEIQSGGEYATLSDGQAVEFEVGQGQKGPCANKVVAV